MQAELHLLQYKFVCYQDMSGACQTKSAFTPLTFWQKTEVTLDQRKIVLHLVLVILIVAPYDDVDAMRELAERCDVLTYEFENVDADGLDAVIKDGQLPQGTDLLRISQNRIFEKDFLSNKAQVTVAPYKVVTSSQDLADIDISKNYVLKTRPVVTTAMVKRSFVQKQIWKKPMR